jgi:hypothetical protein
LLSSSSVPNHERHHGPIQHQRDGGDSRAHRRGSVIAEGALEPLVKDRGFADVRVPKNDQLQCKGTVWLLHLLRGAAVLNVRMGG